MFTELIGFLIIIGVMIVVIIRRQFFKKQLEKDDFGTATTQMQQQFEETADQIIERIGNQIDRLELLIQAADDKIIQLDQKLKVGDLQKKKMVLDDGRNQDLTVTKPIEKKTKSFQEVLQESTRDGEVFVEDSVPEILPKQVKLKVSKTNKMVFEMLEQGESIESISKKTGIGKGAINLIREMYKLQKTV
jgi:hypothetical protein